MTFKRKKVDDLIAASPFFKPPTPEQVINDTLVAASKKAWKMIDEATNDEDLTKALGVLETINEYQDQVFRTANAVCDLTNCCFGMIGETGEVVDLIKKHIYHGHPMDDSLRQKITKELGDVMWYICALATMCDIQMEDVLDKNVEKLAKRYPNGFTLEASLNRDAKEE